nr:transposase [Citricoccus sp.]
MPKDISQDQPTTRRYSAEEKAAAVRMVRTLRAELGTTQGTVKRVAEQLGYGTESVQNWVKQADVDDGQVPADQPSGPRQRLRACQARNPITFSNPLVHRLTGFVSV